MVQKFPTESNGMQRTFSTSEKKGGRVQHSWNRKLRRNWWLFPDVCAILRRVHIQGFWLWMFSCVTGLLDVDSGFGVDSSNKNFRAQLCTCSKQLLCEIQFVENETNNVCGSSSWCDGCSCEICASHPNRPPQLRAQVKCALRKTVTTTSNLRPSFTGTSKSTSRTTRFVDTRNPICKCGPRPPRWQTHASPTILRASGSMMAKKN